MNYEEARQIGPDGPNPGKWNCRTLRRMEGQLVLWRAAG